MGETGQRPSAAAQICPICATTYGPESKFCTHDGSPLAPNLDGKPAGDPLIGTVLADRYRIVRLIGEGGMGKVYEAQHVNIAKRYAIKLLRSNVMDNAESVTRFRQEAWAASSIGHPNIIDIEDFATLPDGGVYLAMEFLEGESLDARMRKQELSLGEVVHVMVQVCDALGAAHEKGIIHRDIKPENIFLQHKNGKDIVKLLDFGIAKITDEGGNHLTKTGAVFGTPFYMSPEQALGRPLDFRTDIYSTGVILYELAVGHVPFQAQSFLEVLHHHITSAPTPPSAEQPAVSPQFEAVILRAMDKEPDGRYASMRELDQALRQVGAAVLGVDPGSFGLNFAPTPGPMRSPSGVLATATPSGKQSQPKVAAGRVSSPPRPASGTTNPPPASVPPSAALSLPPGATGTALPPASQPGSGGSSKAWMAIAALAFVGLAVGGYLAVGAFSHRTAASDGTPPTPTPTPTPTPNPTPNPPVKVAEKPPEKPAEKPAEKPPEKPAEKPAEKPPERVAAVDKTHHDKVDKPKKPDKPAAVFVAKNDDKPKGTTPPQKSEIVDPYATPPSNPPPRLPPYNGVPRDPPPPPVRTEQPRQTLGSSGVDAEVARRQPGLHRVGPVLRGPVQKDDGHNDYTIQLEGGRCYTIAGMGGPGVKEVSLYLWNPQGKRVATERAKTPTATTFHCTIQPGPFHVQVKVTEGVGDTQIGVYTR